MVVRERSWEGGGAEGMRPRLAEEDWLAMLAGGAGEGGGVFRKISF
jgi:hypothetical protein